MKELNLLISVWLGLQIFTLLVLISLDAVGKAYGFLWAIKPVTCHWYDFNVWWKNATKPSRPLWYKNNETLRQRLLVKMNDNEGGNFIDGADYFERKFMRLLQFLMRILSKNRWYGGRLARCFYMEWFFRAAYLLIMPVLMVGMLAVTMLLLVINLFI